MIRLIPYCRIILLVGSVSPEAPGLDPSLLPKPGNTSRSLSWNSEEMTPLSFLSMPMSIKPSLMPLEAEALTVDKYVSRQKGLSSSRSITKTSRQNLLKGFQNWNMETQWALILKLGHWLEMIFMTIWPINWNICQNLTRSHGKELTWKSRFSHSLWSKVLMKFTTTRHSAQFSHCFALKTSSTQSNWPIQALMDWALMSTPKPEESKWSTGSDAEWASWMKSWNQTLPSHLEVSEEAGTEESAELKGINSLRTSRCTTFHERIIDYLWLLF